MRLIDADSIKFRPYYDDYVDYDGYINDLKTWQLDDILSNRVDNAQTVKAIPIEWIKKWCNEEHNRKSLEERLLKRYGVITMLEDWEKENQSLE